MNTEVLSSVVVSLGGIQRELRRYGLSEVRASWPESDGTAPSVVAGLSPGYWISCPTAARSFSRMIRQP